MKERENRSPALSKIPSNGLILLAESLLPQGVRSPNYVADG
jgi:hypothetical protein